MRLADSRAEAVRKIAEAISDRVCIDILPLLNLVNLLV